MTTKYPERLIDLVTRETYAKRPLIPVNYRERLISARKFVLDEPMSEFLADLSNAATNEAVMRQHDDDGERLFAIMHGARRMARAPFPTTWIEYDCRARRRRSWSAWPQNAAKQDGDDNPVNEKDVCPRVGWLIEQHPGIEGAYKLTEFCEWAHQKDRIAMMPYALTWVADDTLVIPWKSIPFSDEGRRPSEIATGVMGYITEHASIAPTEVYAAWVKIGGIDAITKQLRETMGEMRCAWMLLTSLNRIPTVYDTIRPQKGYVAKGNYRRFFEHTVIRLTLPAHRSMKTLALRVLIHARRKGHEVRGFWRNDWRHPRTAGCNHVWINHDEHTLACQHCDGRMIHVKAHHRGDDSLGYVLHDYSVEKGAA
jgi:hypothetical protein